jgi:precorrin-6B methylase 2
MHSQSYKGKTRLFGTLAFLVAFSVPGLAAAQTAQDQFVPEVGQEGKDVVWVPSEMSLVQRMLEIAKVTPKDYLIDLGSGDGRTVIAAAKRGLKAHGIEYNPKMVALSKANAAKEGVADSATFEQGDIFVTDFSKANVLTMFLLEEINQRLRPKILDMKPGTRIVTNTFTMGEWAADQTSHVTGNCDNWCTTLLWYVPAKVQGNWRLGDRQLKLTQTFQMLSGDLGGKPISAARMKGAEISFTVDGVAHTGSVDGNTMMGRRADGSIWAATRID